MKPKEKETEVYISVMEEGGQKDSHVKGKELCEGLRS